MDNDLKLLPGKKVHFIGIGGVGMSGLAQILLAQGYQISGSDIKTNVIIDRLKSQGAKICIGHDCANLPKDTDLVIYSSCITPENPEMAAASEKKLKLISRGKLLSLLMKNKLGVAIAGAHGKTTTTSLITVLLRNAGLDPTYAIGADVNILGGNSGFGQGDHFVAESDESDGSFLFLNPHFGVITNIDREHLDYYHSFKNVVGAYKKFIENMDKNGCLFCCGEDKNVLRLMKKFPGEKIVYGFSEKFDIFAKAMRLEGRGSTFECYYQGKLFDEYRLNIPGAHNILNSLACIAVGIKLGIDRKIIRESLLSFFGASRRFQVNEFSSKIMIVDDYAHHPTEIMATLKAARALNNKRIVGVFQPHRYSRTKFLKKEFGSCFLDADHLVITDIYSASEAPIKGVAARTIYDQVKRSGHKSVCMMPKEKVNKYLLENIREGDLLMMLGAGDICNLTRELVEELKKLSNPE